MMLTKDQHYNLTVIKILERGAVCTVSGIDNRTGFVHISAIANCFVSNISDFVTVGETYDGVCLDADKFNFSLLHLDLKKKQSTGTDKAEKPEKPIRQETAKKTTQPPSDRKPFSSKPKIYSLDDMIARADASLKDKQRSRHNDRTKQRRHHKNSGHDDD